MPQQLTYLSDDDISVVPAAISLISQPSDVAGQQSEPFACEKKAKVPGKQTVGDPQFSEMFLDVADRMKHGVYGAGPEKDKKKIHLFTAPNMKLPWLQFYNEMFHGWRAANGDYIPGPMAGFETWADRPDEKMRNMAKPMVKFYHDSALKKMETGEERTLLEEYCFDIWTEWKMAQQRVDQARREAAKQRNARKAQNEAAETGMGLRRPKKHRTIYRRAVDALGGKTRGVGPGKTMHNIGIAYYPFF